MKSFLAFLALFFAGFVPSIVLAVEPALPPGLEEEEEGDEEPALPEGLAPDAPEEGPDLPPGLEDGREDEEEKPAPEYPPELSLRARLPFRLRGYVDGRFGVRTQRDRRQSDVSLGELRTQLDAERFIGNTRLRVVSDFVYDPVLDEHSIKAREGQGWIDLRQANVVFTPLDFMDIRAGRQVVSWGTGDLLFLNDLFPKDWRAFFIGRDVEYLKAPSDALRASMYGDMGNLEIVYTPRFNPDRFIDGRRISYWNENLGSRAGRDNRVEVIDRDRWLHDEEIAARLHRNIQGLELAGYFYSGFWKSPAGMDPRSRRATFPRLSVYGASARQSIFNGIGNTEVAYYDSREDNRGKDPMVRNSEWRWLLGYAREVVPDLTAGVQYYIEFMENYSNYKDSFGNDDRARDRVRHVITLRLTQMLMRQNLELSLFTFYSPSDHDAYLRPKATYQITDNWMIEGGANVFTGQDAHTFFNQFQRNSNIYSALRWRF